MARTSADKSSESTRAQTTVIGLFRARGDAQNAHNRLKTDGVPEEQMVLKVLKETAPVPRDTQLELDTLTTFRRKNRH
jgi:hypothetical protein